MARSKQVQNVDEADEHLVDCGGFRDHHYTSWPRTWCSQEEAVERGAMIVAELWPEETAEPIDTRNRGKWIQRSRQL